MGTVKLKREDIGIFNPEHNNPKKLSTVNNSKALVFTSVHSFINQLCTLTEHQAICEEAAYQIVALFETLLSSSALIWWSNKKTYNNR